MWRFCADASTVPPVMTSLWMLLYPWKKSCSGPAQSLYTESDGWRFQEEWRWWNYSPDGPELQQECHVVLEKAVHMFSRIVRWTECIHLCRHRNHWWGPVEAPTNLNHRQNVPNEERKNTDLTDSFKITCKLVSLTHGEFWSLGVRGGTDSEEPSANIHKHKHTQAHTCRCTPAHTGTHVDDNMPMHVHAHKNTHTYTHAQNHKKNRKTLTKAEKRALNHLGNLNLPLFLFSVCGLWLASLLISLLLCLCLGLSGSLPLCHSVAHSVSWVSVSSVCLRKLPYCSGMFFAFCTRRIFSVHHLKRIQLYQ